MTSHPVLGRQQAQLPTVTCAPRQSHTAQRQPFGSTAPSGTCRPQLHRRRKGHLPAAQSRPLQSHLQANNRKAWPLSGLVAPLLIRSGASKAGEFSEAATEGAAAAAQATPELPPTVTFGGSFGQYDPIIAVSFYAVVAALLVLTLGVTYLSIRNWQDSTDEKKERAMYSRSSQDRDLAEMSVKARSRRQPPKSKASKDSNKGFGS